MNSKEQMTHDEQVLDAEIAVKEGNDEINIEENREIDPRDVRITELEAQIIELQQKERDALLRAKAEVENIRRRTEQDIEKAYKFSLEKFSTALLPVIDNLEKAIELADKSNEALKPMIEGVELTLKSFLDATGKFGIETISETNVPFNPELHQAMTMMESAQHEPNHVMLVMQKGYLLNGRLIRPAMVAVSKTSS